MAPAEKESAMAAFRAGDVDVLVATTVIEVGVDVPNATVMVILDADRFGIAQLHQLRGRVGRGTERSQCWLVTAPPADGDGPGPRVEALVATTDGFELAEVDLDLRGEGTLMSSAQKGRSDLRLASLRRDRELVRLARDAAFEIVDADPVLAANPALLDELRLLLTDEDAEFLTRS
jgi:ATP-dependent DNA helicase RecG